MDEGRRMDNTNLVLNAPGLIYMDEFFDGIIQLHEDISKTRDWSDLEVHANDIVWELGYEGLCLSATRFLVDIEQEVSSNYGTDESLIEVDKEEDDDDQVIRVGIPPRPRVEYEVHYHQSYQVPVLYFFLKNMPVASSNPLDLVYDYVVSDGWRDEVKRTAILGAISQTDHPIANQPCFFVHPCATPDAMAQLADSRTLTCREYIEAWFGIIAAPVGLHLPIMLA